MYFTFYYKLLFLALFFTEVQSDDNGHAGNSQEAAGQQSNDPGPIMDDSSSSPEPTETATKAPEDISIIRFNDTSVVIRWEIQDSVQKHINHFMVQYRSLRSPSQPWKTEDKLINGMVRAYQINGLRPGKYLFAVVAVYAGHDSATSKPTKYHLRARSKIQPQDLPEMKAPEVFWNETGSDYFRFKWRYEPKASDVEDFGFLVYYRSAYDVDDFIIYNTMDENVEIAEVESNTLYEAKVIAYNEHAVSEFSELISIRTKSISNSTTSAPMTPTTATAQTSTPTPTSTRRPFTTDVIPDLPSTVSPVTTQTKSPTPEPGQDTTVVPRLETPRPKPNSFMDPIISFFKPIFTDRSDTMLVSRYLLLVLLPIFFLSFSLILCLRPYRRKKDYRSESTDADLQFDLVIGYFENSFPGVEKEYSSMSNGTHTGFVNHHPNIGDFS